jgi:hypothetical protein
MRKRHFLLLAVAIASLTLNGCSGGVQLMLIPRRPKV